MIKMLVFSSNVILYSISKVIVLVLVLVVVVVVVVVVAE